ncbi:hypothetical protein C4571_02385 [Candidatus Parcubacteria bacterium]|nr:MAG: hypothetical protein C4571_02385 [Candidatus Parcubacteria bacterium]
MEKSTCPDCGSSPVVHNAEWLSAFFDRIFTPLYAPFEKIRKLCAPPFQTKATDRALVKLFETLSSAGLMKIQMSPDEKNLLLAVCLWDEAVKRGIRMREFRPFGFRRDIFAAEYGGDTRVFDSIPRPRGTWPESINWMDDKSILKGIFLAAGFPSPSGGARVTLRGGLKLFRTLRKPVVTKPSIGSASRHTTTHIGTESEFERAFTIAQKLSPFVVVEEECLGPVFRATVIAGVVEGVIRRDPPEVVGDAKRTVRELVEEENRNPLRDGPHFHAIKFDEAAERELRRQGVSWDTVPKRGERIALHEKINWSVGGTTTDVSEKTHPENIRLFEEIAKFLENPIIGIDFVIEDISRPRKEQDRCGVIELNSRPFIDNHHYPFSGKPRNIAGAIWDMVFPASRARK